MKLPTQVSIGTILLLTGCIAVWVAHRHNQSQIESLTIKLESARLLAHELIILDSTQLSVVHQDPRRYDEEVWQLYLPVEGLELNIATTGLPTVNSDTDSSLGELSNTSVVLPAGRHRLELLTELVDDQWHIRVELDHKEILNRIEPRSWNDWNGSYGGHRFSQQENLDPRKAAILFHRVFSVQVPEGNGRFKMEPNPERSGILLWIAPSKNPSDR